MQTATQMWMVLFYIVHSLASVGCRVKKAKSEHDKINKEMFRILTDFQGIKGTAILDTCFYKVK